ncbi:hypothetical protein LTR36_006444 [Oleoguttula mirabilis]|uniref:Mediator of RNA polymerase II transcription subunit 13 n=1 Tax=Oleoguttula mirabilis TaxID=1507867 RepID=A0AAV9JUP5_9PEZI|nr:hypothetical protein LTR36_006444 [Oleoguttula mirabilis]
MDFFTSCRTNVLIAEDIRETPCKVWESDGRRDMYAILAGLRAHDMLCAAAGQQLWVFGPVSDEAIALLDDAGLTPQVEREQKWTLATSSSRVAADGSTVQEVLLDAIHGALSFKLGIACGALRMGRWTWLFPATNDANGHRLLLSVNVHMNDAGALYATTTTEWCDMTALDVEQAVDGGSVWIAPGGSKAQLVLGDSTTEGAMVVDGEAWEAHVATMLRAEGIGLPDEPDWVHVRLLQDEKARRDVMWPAALCLTPAPPPTTLFGLQNDADQWKQYFTAEDDPTRFRNPLAVAEDWFLGASQRESNAAANQPGPIDYNREPGDAMPTTTTAMADMDAILAATSPPFVQRIADQQAGLSGIYPTPEDNLMAGLPTSQPASSASLMADNNHNSMMTAGTLGEATGLNGDLLPNSDDMLLPRGHSSSSEPVAAYPPSAHDDLFGDMGGMDFGGGEVGDADFDFFNEEDGEDASALRVEDEGTPVLMVDQGGDTPEQSFGPAAEILMSERVRFRNEHAAPDEAMATPEQQGAGGRGAEMGQSEAVLPTTTTTTTTAPPSPEVALELPLTPFTIKEQLLPPPIPASTTSHAPVAEAGRFSRSLRRTSTFDPVVFKEGLDLMRQYSVPYGPPDTLARGYVRRSREVAPNISLPPRRKKPRPTARPLEVVVGREAETDDGEGGGEGGTGTGTGLDGEGEGDGSVVSEEDSYESASSLSDVSMDLPPKLPWDKKKRKRGDDGVGEGEGTSMWEAQRALMLGRSELPDMRSPGGDGLEEEAMEGLLWELVGGDGGTGHWDAEVGSHTDEGNKLPPVEACFFPQGATADVSYIAQLASEQAVSCTSAIVQALDLLAPAAYDAPASSSAEAVRGLAELVLKRILPRAEHGDVAKLALIREPPPASRGGAGVASSAATPSRTTTSNTSRAPGQPRPPPQRASDSVAVGGGVADTFAIPAPFIRVQRGPDTYEMLASALPFWTEMGLAPANGAKDVRAFCVFPNNEDLRGLVEAFLREVGGAYEGCKMGSHVHVRDVEEDEEGEGEGDDYEDGLVAVQCQDGEEGSVQSALRAFRRACPALGEFLARRISHLEPERTIVVYMVNPFPSAEDRRAVQHLCACFWYLYKAYRDSVAKAPKQKSLRRSDIVLQIIPIELIACSAADAMVVLDSRQCAAVAKEVYNRCPPRNADTMMDATSALPIYAAPFVELASPPPKRLNFQLTGDAPSDLLHEGSALHLAYAVSADQQFMAVAWVDSTGRYHASMVYGLRGRSFALVAAEVWAWTCDEILAAREVTWRIFVVAVGVVGESYSRCWKTIIGSRRRKQAFSVTLLAAELEPALRLTPASPPPPPSGLGGEPGGGMMGGPGGTAGGGFLTPASTPQGATSLTVSPADTSAFAFASGPLTPAPSETAAAITDSDPDAHVIELADESWGVLFSPAYAASAMSGAGGQAVLATGALFKRGGDDGHGHGFGEGGGLPLPGLVVGLVWTVQVRPNGNVDEGNGRQAEMTVREVLRMWRGLSVLATARGLGGSGVGGGVMPVHLLAALRGAEGVEGLLSAAAA